MRILIVEDSDSIRRMLEALVSARADEIVGVATGDQGLDQAFASPPDVVLLDLNLPGMYNGIEVCARLRADPKTRKVPVFIITASADDETKVRAIQAGATRFFPKPFSPRAILSAIDDVRRLISPAVTTLTRPPTPFGSFAPLAPPSPARPTEPPRGGSGAFSPAHSRPSSLPAPRLPESSDSSPKLPETSRPPGSVPPKRT
jgi:DNA-binding response OmpR family regulator